MGAWRQALAQTQPVSRLVIAAGIRMPNRHLLWWLLLPIGCAGGWWLKRGYGGTIPNMTNDSEKGHPPIESNPSRFWWFLEYTPWSVSSPRAEPALGWFFWGFRLVAWFGGVRIFSKPGEGGSLSLHGGWLLFLVDACGVWMFGSVASMMLTTFGICLLGLTAWSLQALSRLWCCRGLVSCCSRTAGRGPDPFLAT